VSRRIETFKHDGGIKELVKTLCEGKTALLTELEVIAFDEQRKGVGVEVALQWSKDVYVDSLTGFANGIRTADGGSHLDGFKTAVTKTINGYAKKVMRRRVFDVLLVEYDLLGLSLAVWFAYSKPIRLP